MPTRDVLASFWRDWDKLTPQQQRAFREAVAQFIADLGSGGQGFHPRLRVKRVQGHPGVWEMTGAYDGRATFQYGEEVHSGQPHIIWRRSAPTRSSVVPDRLGSERLSLPKRSRTCLTLPNRPTRQDQLLALDCENGCEGGHLPCRRSLSPDAHQPFS